MKGLDYSDYYRLRVSLGVAMVAAAGTVVWLYAGSDFGIVFSAAEFDTLRPGAQELVLRKERLAAIEGLLAPSLRSFWPPSVSPR